MYISMYTWQVCVCMRACVCVHVKVYLNVHVVYVCESVLGCTYTHMTCV